MCIRDSIFASNESLFSIGANLISRSIPLNNKKTKEEPTKRPLVQKTKKTALGTSTDRNAAYEVTSLIDYNKLGYVARPNERQVTVERTYDSNFKSYINNPELGYQDKQKTTKRQTTMYSDSRNPASFVPEDTSRLNFCLYSVAIFAQ